MAGASPAGPCASPFIIWPAPRQIDPIGEDFMDSIREWWGAIMAATGLGVWLIRLEGTYRTALREVERLEKQLDADRKAISETRREQNEMLPKCAPTSNACWSAAAI